MLSALVLRKKKIVMSKYVKPKQHQENLHFRSWLANTILRCSESTLATLESALKQCRKKMYAVKGCTDSKSASFTEFL